MVEEINQKTEEDAQINEAGQEPNQESEEQMQIDKANLWSLSLSDSWKSFTIYSSRFSSLRLSFG